MVSLRQNIKKKENTPRRSEPMQTTWMNANLHNMVKHFYIEQSTYSQFAVVFVCQYLYRFVANPLQRNGSELKKYPEHTSSALFLIPFETGRDFFERYVEVEIPSNNMDSEVRRQFRRRCTYLVVSHKSS